MRRRSVRRVLLALIGALYVLSIPWYRTGGTETELWLGLPSWVTVAILCYAAAAVLNALAWLLTEIPDIPDGPDSNDAPGGTS